MIDAEAPDSSLIDSVTSNIADAASSAIKGGYRHRRRTRKSRRGGKVKKSLRRRRKSRRGGKTRRRRSRRVLAQKINFF